MINKDQAKKNLNALKTEYEERISKINDHILHPQDDLNQHWEDQAIIVSQNEMRASLLQEAEDNLVLVNEALEKLTNDEYGYCEECGEEIEEKRLESIPYATYCIKHAQ